MRLFAILIVTGSASALARMLPRAVGGQCKAPEVLSFVLVDLKYASTTDPLTSVTRVKGNASQLETARASPMPRIFVPTVCLASNSNQGPYSTIPRSG